MNSDIVDDMSDGQVRLFAKQLIESLEMAENEGIFGNDSWHGFLQIEIEADDGNG